MMDVLRIPITPISGIRPRDDGCNLSRVLKSVRIPHYLRRELLFDRRELLDFAAQIHRGVSER